MRENELRMQARDILRDPDPSGSHGRRGRPGGPDIPLSRGTGNLVQLASAVLYPYGVSRDQMCIRN